MYWFLRGVFSPLFRLIFRIEFFGRENLPASGGYILVSNHRSGFDPLFLAIGSKRQLHFMAKEELMKTPVIGWILKKAQCFGVSRGSGDTGALDAAVSYLKHGEIVGIFPEGTRAEPGITLRPKSGASHIARMAGVGVLPCCVSIDGKARIGARVKVCYGKPISYEELGLQAEGSAGLRSATRTMWQNGVLPLLEKLEGTAN